MTWRTTFSISARTAAAATLAALALAQPANTTAASAQAGRASGTWVLPVSANLGWIDGDLFTAPPNPQSAYHFAATLTAFGLGCPACIGGSIQGSLDDGLPGTPNLTVVGFYTGEFATGSGAFEALVYGSLNTPPVGRIRGVFSNPPLLPVLGQFHGKWVVR